MENDPKKSLTQKLQEDLEIVELYEKLDMTFDPLSSVVIVPQTPNTNCNNNNCC